MKLLMITGFGGSELAQGKMGAFYNTLEEFHKYWERVDIICPAASSPLRQSFSEAGKRQETKEFFGNVFIHPSPWPLWLQPFWILKKGRKLHREHRFDLVTAHEYPPFYNGIGARMLWGKTGIPYVLEIHHIPGHPKAADLKERFYKWATRQFIKYDAARAKAVRVVNQHQAPEFLIRAGIPENKIVYNPSMYIDLDIFKHLEMEKKYDLIFIGRLVKNKGIDLLIEAVSKLKTQISNFKLLIVGAGPLRENLKFKIENLKLQNNVFLYGWAKDSAEAAYLLNQSKILVAPSYNEGGPRVVLEAMACGVPVLATPVGIVPDIIENAGEIIGWSPVDISEKAAELLKNQDKYQKFSKTGPEIAKNFEKATAIQNYAQKLQNLLN